jgi:Putative transposase/Transposase zinc-binding domain
MTTLGDIVRHSGDAYRAAYHEQLLPSHDAALRAIAQCRTAALGGHLYACPDCGTLRYSYHSCRNRHCPSCQHDATQDWLRAHQDLLLPLPHFLLTFTIPSELRAIAYRHQRQFYALFFRASASALQHLAADPRFVGGKLGLLGVLQTWTRDLRYHPHIHYLVPAIGLRADGQFCQPRNPGFLVPLQALAIVFRAKLRAALRQTDFWSEIDGAVWSKPWVVDCRAVGTGAAALKYLAPYIFQVALSNKRLVSFVNERVTFGYIDGASHQPKRCTVPVLTFLHRFVQHILPRGFVKVRQFGLFGRRYCAALAQLRAQLALRAASTPPQETSEPTTPPARRPLSEVDRCPKCGQVMRARPLAPQRNRGPPAARHTKGRQESSLTGRIFSAPLLSSALPQGRDPKRAENLPRMCYDE